MVKIKERRAVIKIKRAVKEYLKQKYGKGYTRYHNIYKRGKCYYLDLTYYYKKSIVDMNLQYCDGRIERL